jgi:hypothetical protein
MFQWHRTSRTTSIRQLFDKYIVRSLYDRAVFLTCSLIRYARIDCGVMANELAFIATPISRNPSNQDGENALIAVSSVVVRNSAKLHVF